MSREELARVEEAAKKGKAILWVSDSAGLLGVLVYETVCLAVNAINSFSDRGRRFRVIQHGETVWKVDI